MRGRSLRAGVRALSHLKLILLLTVSTALLGIVSAAPLGPVLWSRVGETLAGEHFLRNHPTFAPSDFIDLVQTEASALLGVRNTARVAVALGLALQMFFVGGIVAVLGRGRFGFGQFFEQARRNFWHNVKCFFIFLVLLLVVFGTLLPASEAAADAAFRDAPPDSAGRAAFEWARRGVCVLLFGAFALLYDFARAVRRYSPAAGALRGYRFALKSLRGSWVFALALFLFWLAAGLLAIGGGLALAATLPAKSAWGIGLLFLAQFAALGLRSAVRIAAWGSYLAFLDTRARGAVAATTRIRYREAGAPVPGVA